MSCDIKYIIHPILVAMAFAVLSCSSEPGPVVSLSPEQMVFELAGSSRAVATTNENIKDNAFMLFGDVNMSGTKDTIFHWHPVKYKDGEWNYGDTTQYWFMGMEHSFVAIHPFLSKDNEQVTILEYDDSKLSFTYKLPEKLEDAADLLFATHRRKYSLDNKGPVYLEFTHLLARIDISMALVEDELMYDYVEEDPRNALSNKNEYIAVHSVEFQNIRTSASFTFTAKPLENGKTSTYDYVKGYLPVNEKVESVTVTLKKPCIVPNSYKEGLSLDNLKYVSALKDEIIVMLPQEFTKDTKIVVNYSINEDVDLMRKIVLNLKDLKGITDWTEGTRYTYKILVDDPYKGHIVPQGVITVDIDDLRLQEDEGDDSWITDDEDETHNIGYIYNGENSGPK